MAMNQPGTDRGEKGETGEREPKGAKGSDSGGERSTGMKNGVGMGRADATGANKLLNTGKTEGTCYTHGRKSYQ